MKKCDFCKPAFVLGILVLLLCTTLTLFILSEIFGYKNIREFLEVNGSFLGSILGAIVLAITVYFTITKQSENVNKQINEQKELGDKLLLDEKKEKFVFSLSKMIKEFDRGYLDSLELLGYFLNDIQRKKVRNSSMAEGLKATLSSIKYVGKIKSEVDDIANKYIVSLTSRSTYEVDVLNKLYFNLEKYDELKDRMRKLEEILIDIFNYTDNPNRPELIEYFEKQYELYCDYEDFAQILIDEVVDIKEIRSKKICKFIIYLKIKKEQKQSLLFFLFIENSLKL